MTKLEQKLIELGYEQEEYTEVIYFKYVNNFYLFINSCNLKKYGVNVVVCLNKFGNDTDEDIDLLRKHCEEKGYLFSLSTAYVDGGRGAHDLANIIMNLPTAKFKCLYDLESSVVEKINCVCKEI